MRLNRLCVIFAAVEIAAAALLVYRHFGLDEIRRGNEALREELSTGPDTSTATQAPAATGISSAITLQEKNELLRLRGQIGQLRRELQSLQNSK